MAESEKITIVEGPPPTFQLVQEPLLLGTTEGPQPREIAMCRLRTFNGPELVERCHRAWRHGQAIRLEFRGEDGLTQEAPIVAARWMEIQEGHMLLLWVSLADDDVSYELDIEEGEDYDDLFDDDVGDLDWDLDV
jgi:hypothetical protein